MTQTAPAPEFYISSSMIDAARTALAAHNWQISTQVAHVERAAVLQLVIDWAQGRVEAPEAVAEVMSDLHIGPGRSGYTAAQRANLILAHLASKHEADERSAHGTPSRVLHAPLTAEGLKALTAWLEAQPVRETPAEVGEADSTLELHPRVRSELKRAGITSAEDRAAVLAHANFRKNVSGGRSSDWIGAAAQAMRHAGGAEALREQDRQENARLCGKAWEAAPLTQATGPDIGSIRNALRGRAWQDSAEAEHVARAAVIAESLEMAYVGQKSLLPADIADQVTAEDTAERLNQVLAARGQETLDRAGSRALLSWLLHHPVKR